MDIGAFISTCAKNLFTRPFDIMAEMNNAVNALKEGDYYRFGDRLGTTLNMIVQWTYKLTSKNKPSNNFLNLMKS